MFWEEQPGNNRRLLAVLASEQLTGLLCDHAQKTIHNCGCGCVGTWEEIGNNDNPLGVLKAI